MHVENEPVDLVVYFIYLFKISQNEFIGIHYIHCTKQIVSCFSTRLGEEEKTDCWIAT